MKSYKRLLNIIIPVFVFVLLYFINQSIITPNQHTIQKALLSLILVGLLVDIRRRIH